MSDTKPINIPEEMLDNAIDSSEQEQAFAAQRNAVMSVEKENKQDSIEREKARMEAKSLAGEDGDDTVVDAITAREVAEREEALAGTEYVLGSDGVPVKKKSALKITLTALAIVLVLGGLVLFGVLWRNSKITSVPDVVGMTKQAAQIAIENSSLKCKLDYENSDTIEVDHVISQSKRAGSSVNKNTAITIIISKGNGISVPNFIGKTLAQATKEAALLGLNLEVDEVHSTVPSDKGQITSQSVKAGTQVKKGDVIRIVFGDKIEKVKVPDLSGLTKYEAQLKLEEVELVPKFIERYSDTVDEGDVIAQNIAAGTQAEKGTTVIVDISMGAADSDADADYTREYDPANYYTGDNDDNTPAPAPVVTPSSAPSQTPSSSSTTSGSSSVPAPSSSQTTSSSEPDDNGGDDTGENPTENNEPGGGEATPDEV